MTSQGHAQARLSRALARGDLLAARAAAGELPAVNLSDAAAMVVLIRALEPARFERAAVRWVGRLALERQGVALDDLRLAVAALRRLPDDDALAALKRLGQR